MYIINNRCSYGDTPPKTPIKVKDAEGKKLIRHGWKACEEDGTLIEPEPEPQTITISRSEFDAKLAEMRKELREELLAEMSEKPKLNAPVKTPLKVEKKG